MGEAGKGKAECLSELDAMVSNYKTQILNT